MRPNRRHGRSIASHANSGSLTLHPSTIPSRAGRHDSRRNLIPSFGPQPSTVMTIRAMPPRSLQPILRIPLILPQTCLRPAIPALLVAEQKQPAVPTTLRTFHCSTRRVTDFDPRSIQRESDEVDVCIVGGGPAGLSAAIRLKQLAKKENREMRVLLLEKGSEMGSPTPETLITRN